LLLLRRPFASASFGLHRRTRDDASNLTIIPDANHSSPRGAYPRAFFAQGGGSIPSTTTTSKLQESLRATPGPGNTAGRSQTCASTRAGVRTTYSDCAGARKTSASPPCRAPY